MNTTLASFGRKAKPWMIRGLTALLLLASFFASRPVAAETEKEFDQRISAELEAQNPEAARLFEQANQARDRGDIAGARSLYEEVHKLAPGFYHATRRLCGAEVRLRQRAQAIAHCREALAAAKSAENLSALASALSSSPAEPSDLREANQLSSEATALAPNSAFVWFGQCELALLGEDTPQLRVAVSRLEVLAANDSSTDVCAAFLAKLDERNGDASAALERARAHGLSKEAHDNLVELFDKAVPWPTRAWRIAWRVGVVWLGGFAALLLAGWLLSRAALRSASNLAASSQGHPQGAEKTLRRIYRGVLWLCCGYYYLSLPLVLLLVVGAGGAVIIGFFMVGTVPIKLVCIIGVVVLSTCWAVLKSIFVRPKNVDPGVRLDLAEHPRFQAALAEIAEKIGTDPVDIVYLTPGTEVAVMERGEMRGLLRGRGKRCLILGAGVLKGMKVIELKSILAHEHGHLHNEDTAGGGFALAVRRSLITMAIALAQARAAAWYNPAWWFLRGFDRVFLVISQGASRLQEVLADRWAVHAYGSEAFAGGLRHVVIRSARFKAHLNATLTEVVKEATPLLNLYTYKPLEEANVDDEIDEAINAEPTAYDSHPSPKDRIAWARNADIPAGEEGPDDKALAWTLFSERRQLEEQMTDEVRDRVFETHRVAIPKPKRVHPSSTGIAL